LQVSPKPGKKTKKKWLNQLFWESKTERGESMLEKAEKKKTTRARGGHPGIPMRGHQTSQAMHKKQEKGSGLGNNAWTGWETVTRT